MKNKAGLTKRAKTLLSAREGLGIDFKREIEAVTADDLCAFANMPEGGVILAGVSEEKQADGTVIGRPMGCAVSDASQLILVNKAQQCHPPIALSLHVEQVQSIRFLRIEIPASGTRPHCTASGRYIARAESRNVPILPPALLRMFLEREAGEFEIRFRRATADITESISETAESVERLQKGIESRIEDIADQLGWSDSMFDDTGSKIDDLDSLVRELLRRAVDSGSRLRHIAAGTKSKDPIKRRALKNAREAIKRELLENLDAIRDATTGDKISYQMSGEIAEELTEAEVQKIFGEVINEILPLSAGDSANSKSD